MPFSVRAKIGNDSAIYSGIFTFKREESVTIYVDEYATVLTFEHSTISKAETREKTREGNLVIYATVADFTKRAGFLIKNLVEINSSTVDFAASYGPVVDGDPAYIWLMVTLTERSA